MAATYSWILLQEYEDQLESALTKDDENKQQHRDGRMPARDSSCNVAR